MYHRQTMKTVAMALCLLVMSGAALAQAEPQPDAAFFHETSDCAAAFKARVNEHKAQPRSDARNRAILDDTEMSYVYVGVAYKQGLRNPEADQMLKASEKHWALLAKAEQQSMLTACSTRALKMMSEVSGIERYIVRKRAKARVEQLLRKEQP
jgi:Fe-S-cluster-containing hydrogenase component 2